MMSNTRPSHDKHRLPLVATRMAIGSKACLITGLMSTLLVSACGGGGGGSGSGLVAQADTTTLERGARTDLLANDRLDGAAVRAGDGGNVLFTLLSGPAGLTALDDGSVRADSIPAGNYTLSYRICRSAAPADCASANVSLTVVNAPLSASPVTAQLWLGEGAVSLLPGLQEGDAGAPWPAWVVASTLSPLPTGVRLETNGNLSADASAAPGTWVGRYQVCHLAAPSLCAQADLTVIIPRAARLSLQLATTVPVQIDAEAAVLPRECNPFAGDFDCNQLDLQVPADSARRVAVTVGGLGQTPALEGGWPYSWPRQFDLALEPGRWQSLDWRSVSAPVQVLTRQDGTLAEGSTSVTDDGARLSWTDVLDDSGQPVPTPDRLVLSTQAGSSWPLLPAWPTPADAARRFEALALGHVYADRVPRGAVLSLPMLDPSGFATVSAPDTAPLLRHDLAERRWIDVGVARKVTLDGEVFYQAELTQLGTYAVARPFTPVEVTGCVRDEWGVAVAGARVAALGLDHVSEDIGSTDASGAFTVKVKPSSQVRLQAWDIGHEWQTPHGQQDLSVGVSAAVMSDCLPAQGVAHLVLSADRAFALSGAYLGSRTASLTSVVQPDGTVLDNPDDSALQRPQVGVHQVYARRNLDLPDGAFVPGPGVMPSITVRTADGRQQSVFGPVPFGNASSGWWHLADIEVSADCRVALVPREGVVDALPTPTGETQLCIPPALSTARRPARVRR